MAWGTKQQETNSCGRNKQFTIRDRNPQRLVALGAPWLFRFPGTAKAEQVAVAPNQPPPQVKPCTKAPKQQHKTFMLHSFGVQAILFP